MGAKQGCEPKLPGRCGEDGLALVGGPRAPIFGGKAADFIVAGANATNKDIARGELQKALETLDAL